jgi:thymidylate synthase ThyX
MPDAPANTYYDCSVVADSLAPSGVRLTTLAVTFPRIVLAEFNTHRAFSRNAASSRAIPVRKMIERVEASPFIPEFAANKAGMQAGDPLDEQTADKARGVWLEARNHMALAAWLLSRGEASVHKQWVNRLLEPFSWTTVVVTSTDWGNFFGQRCHPDAQPELRRAALMMRDALNGSTPQAKNRGGWHLPFILDADWSEAIARFNSVERETQHLIQVSVARCARVSYLNHDGERDQEADVALYRKLLHANPPHFSPFEHVAQASDRMDLQSGNFRGWYQLRKAHELGVFTAGATG